MRKFNEIALYVYLAILFIQVVWMLISSWTPSRINIAQTYCVAMLSVIILINITKEK